ncbi:hypothetical protein N4221_07950 [Yersinia enterocolitica]|uniref:hypothetical protein n=1 Tax=Yersinia enterocolitica TaxID=630 RepID=UPI0021E94511|nr:hypothetical protein [Yersinia enterocolitica]UYK03345.1 hypothetical protein N4221_07950 [Yersinia enterocolitica]
MNNIEELKSAYRDVELTARNMRGKPEEYRVVTGFCPVNVVEMQAQKIQALIAQLEASQKERDVYAKLASDVGDIITLLQNNEWAEHIGKTNVGGLLEYQITRLMNSIADINTKLLAAEAVLSAANEKLSKPVVLPDYRCSPDMHTKQYYETIGFNLGLDACKAVIKAAGFTVAVEGDADAE